jgi:hypothetical protein
VLDECKFEPVLNRVHRNSPGLSRTIEAVNRLAFDSGEVYRLLQGTNDAIVTEDS